MQHDNNSNASSPLLVDSDILYGSEDNYDPLQQQPQPEPQVQNQGEGQAQGPPAVQQPPLPPQHPDDMIVEDFEEEEHEGQNLDSVAQTVLDFIEDEAVESSVSEIMAEEKEADAQASKAEAKGYADDSKPKSRKSKSEQQEMMDTLRAILDDYTIPKKRRPSHSPSLSSDDSESESDPYDDKNKEIKDKIKKNLKGNKKIKSYKKQGKLRYKIINQILKAFETKYHGSESGSIDDWLNQLEFLIKPHHLRTDEKAYIVVNLVKGRAFKILREHGDSTNYEQLRDLLITEFRTPGAYYSHIQSFCNGRQGDRQKVAGYYRYLTNESSKINEMAKEKI